jgi:hypothetical protein
MSMGKRLARNRKRNLTCSDRPDPHRLVLSIFREAQLSATAFLSRSRSLASFKKTLFKPVFDSARIASVALSRQCTAAYRSRTCERNLQLAN